MTTESRNGATQPVKDMGETLQRLTQARELHEDMTQFARQHKAQDSQLTQRDATGTMKAQNEAIRGGVKSSGNPSPEMGRPDLVIASAAGIAATAADSTHMASGNDYAVTARRDVSIALGRSLLASVRGVIAMIAARFSIRLFAAKGKVQIQARSDETALDALKDFTINSVDGKVILTAKKEACSARAAHSSRSTVAGLSTVRRERARKRPRNGLPGEWDKKNNLRCARLKEKDELGRGRDGPCLSNDAEYSNHTEFIESLQWWDDTGLDNSNVWHFHPFGLVRNFRKCG